MSGRIITIAQSAEVRARVFRGSVQATGLRVMLRARSIARAESGRMNIIGIVGIVLILIFYMVYPEPINHFMRWSIHSVIQAVKDAFGTSDDGGAKDAGQIRTKHGPGSTTP